MFTVQFPVYNFYPFVSSLYQSKRHLPKTTLWNISSFLIPTSELKIMISIYKYSEIETFVFTEQPMCPIFWLYIGAAKRSRTTITIALQARWQPNTKEMTTKLRPYLSFHRTNVVWPGRISYYLNIVRERGFRLLKSSSYVRF